MIKNGLICIGQYILEYLTNTCNAEEALINDHVYFAWSYKVLGGKSSEKDIKGKWIVILDPTGPQAIKS